MSKELFLGIVSKKYFSPSQMFFPVRRPFTTQSVVTNLEGHTELCRMLAYFCELKKDHREREAQSKCRRMGRQFSRLRKLGKGKFLAEGLIGTKEQNFGRL